MSRVSARLGEYICAYARRYVHTFSIEKKRKKKIPPKKTIAPSLTYSRYLPPWESAILPQSKALFGNFSPTARWYNYYRSLCVNHAANGDFLLHILVQQGGWMEGGGNIACMELETVSGIPVRSIRMDFFIDIYPTWNNNFIRAHWSVTVLT